MGDDPGEAEQLRPSRTLGADSGKRGAAFEHDRKRVDEGLDVVDDRGLAEQAPFDRKRRLVARLAAVALDRAEDCGLLTADVGAGPFAQLDLEAHAAGHDVVAQQLPLACLLDGALQPPLCERVLAAQVDVAALAAGCIRGDCHRLDHRERVSLQDHPIFERPRLRLIRVTDQIVRTAGLARHGLPLAPSRKGGAAATHQL